MHWAPAWAACAMRLVRLAENDFELAEARSRIRGKTLIEFCGDCSRFG